MRIKRIPVTSFPFLSLCLAALGFGSCQSKKLTKQQEEKRMELNAKLDNILSEEAATTARLAQLRNDYENIGRGECVYGGPNMMEEAIARMRERQAEQEKVVKGQMTNEEARLDSLSDERTKVLNQLEELSSKKKQR